MGKDDYYMPDDYTFDFSGVEFKDDEDNISNNSPNTETSSLLELPEITATETELPESNTIEQNKSVADIIKNKQPAVENVVFENETPTEITAIETELPESYIMEQNKSVADIIKNKQPAVENVVFENETPTEITSTETVLPENNDDNKIIEDLIKTNKNGISIFFNIEIFKSLLNYKEFSDYVKQTIKTPVKTPVKTSVKTSVKKERTVAEIALKYNIVMTSSMEKLVRSLSQEKNIINSQMALRNAINSRLLALSDQEKENVFKIISEKWNLPEIAEYLPKTKKNNIKVKKTYDELFHKYGISKSFNFDKFKRSVSSLKNGIDYNNLEQVLRDRAVKTSPEILEYLDANIEKFKSVFIEKFNLKPMTGGGNDGSTDKYKYFTVPQNVKHNIEKGLRYAPKTGSNTKNARVLFEMEKIPSKFYYKMRKWFNENSSQEKDFKLWLKNKKTNKKKQITDWLLHGGLDGMKFFTTKK